MFILIILILEALSTGLEWLAEGKDEADVAAMLNIRTHRGEDLSEASREHYDRAMAALREADARDWVFQAEERRRSREEAFALLVKSRGDGAFRFYEGEPGA